MTSKNRTLLLILAILFLLVLGALALPTTQVNASAPDSAECGLTVNRNRVSVTVNRFPCHQRDFPYWCDAYVPQTIVLGQTIRCEYVVVTATRVVPTATPRPTATARPLLERLRFPGFR